MNELALTAVIWSAVVGIAVWHAARVVADGSLFEPLHDWLHEEGYDLDQWELPQPGQDMEVAVVKVHRAGTWGVVARYLHEGIACRLCLNTQVAIVLGVLSLLAVGEDFSLLYGAVPLLSAGFAEVYRRVEAIETP